LFIGHRNVEGGPRSSEFEIGAYNVVTGFRGDLFESWNYEVFGQYSQVDYTETLRNDVVASKAAQALDVVTDPVTGLPVCRAALNGVAADCVPWDIYQPGNVTQGAADFISTRSLRNGDTKLAVLGANVTGDFESYGWVSPWAESAIQAVFGFEFRRDSLELTPDINNSLSLSREPVSGAVPVWELYTEMQAPLAQDKPFANDLTVYGAFRYSDYYDTTGTQSTYSGGITWEPIAGVMVRAQYQRAIRAPNPLELFSDQSRGAFILSAGANGLHDPCSGDFNPDTATPEPASSFEECSRTGVTQAQYGQIIDSSTGEFDTLRGGNPNLDPEESDTWTTGVVLSPKGLPGLNLSLDYFSIDVQGFIGTIPPELTLNNCLDLNDPLFCNLIHRDEFGTLWLVNEKAFIQATLINTGTLKTQGFDISADYAFDLEDWGTLSFKYLATLLDEFKIQSIPGEDTVDCAGFYSAICGPPRPDYRHNASVGWETNNGWGVTLTWRYIDSVKQFGTNVAPVNAKLSATSYFDLFAKYDLSDRWQFRAGINNILDQDPPLTSVSGFGGNEISGRANTYPQLYDVQGRFLFAGIRASFL
jgi:outer membrane receptor protein involved in Fe transport